MEVSFVPEMYVDRVKLIFIVQKKRNFRLIFHICDRGRVGKTVSFDPELFFDEIENSKQVGIEQKFFSNHVMEALYIFVVFFVLKTGRSSV
jgi:hypothetical protein